MSVASTLAPGAALPVAWSAERYHSDTETVSRGGLVDLINDPPRYHAMYEAHTMQRPPPTPAMVFGTLAHMAVLEWPEFERRVIRQAGRDAILIPREEIHRLLAMRRAVLDHEMVAALLTNPTVAEQTILWRPGEAEIVVRVRPDLIVTIEDDEGISVFVPDLKTTEDVRPSAFAQSCARYRYHLQAALYRDAVAALFGTERVHFLFIAVSMKTLRVACYDLDDAALELGRNQHQRALVELQRRRQSGDWTSDWQQSIHTLSLPRWAFHE